MATSEKIKSFIGIFVIIILFIASTIIVRQYLDFFNQYFDIGFLGIIIYVLIVIISIVVASISAFPLIPIASNLWGWFTSGILNIIGWTIGSMIAFILARKYGVPLISKFIPMKRINKIENLVPKDNVFWTVVFLRMVIPVDILSYALGLFSKIGKKRYFFDTLVVVSPFAFVFSYIGVVNIYYQLSELAIALGIFFLGILVAYYRQKRRKNVNKK